MLPCMMGGQAIAEIILGIVNPSGRLSITYPKDQTYDNMVTPYFQRQNGKCQSGSSCPSEWDFGSGLSYTTFSYSNLVLSSTQLNSQSDTLTASVTVTNSGSVSGKETVMLFITQAVRSSGGVPEVKMLKKFTKISLNQGQSQNVQFTIGFDDFGYYPGPIGTGLNKQADIGAYYIGMKPETICDANHVGALCQKFNYGSPSAGIPVTFYAKTNGKIVGTTDWDTFMYAPTSPVPSNEQFIYLPDTKQIQVVGNGKCLDAYPNSNAGAGYSVHLWNCDSTNGNQKWNINAAGHQIKHATHPNLCLDADPTDSQSRLQVWTCASLGTNPNQFFGLSSVTSEPAKLISTTGLEFAASGTAQGSSVLFNPSSAPNFWNFNFMTNQIVVPGTQMCLDAWSATNGGGIHTWQCSASNGNQLWSYDATTGQLRHATHKGFCLDMGSDNGASPYLWTCHDSSDYWFKYQTFKYKNTAVGLA
ncbi:lysosomal beta glucosidase [Thraustotheca clavata]|uniref:beta-glucosidase n=1 Tax=Thraustotheca clavata TaxID=74557 RepID=A0A1V9ZGJ8_9STRA|nr:lysosomal beta glucosidase [Thraustotheca clavata]